MESQLLILRGGEVVAMRLFLVVVVTSISFDIGIQPRSPRSNAPGALSVAALLATVLGPPHALAADRADGTLASSGFSPLPFIVLFASRIAVFWLLCMSPLVLNARLLCLQLGSDGSSLPVSAVTLPIVAPAQSLTTIKVTAWAPDHICRP